MPIRAPYAHAAPTDGQIVCLDQRTPHVSVLHPGYPDPTNVILSLPAQDSALGGLHYATILTACGILCGNRWDGHLTKDRTGQPLIQAPMQIIAPGDYYLHFPLENDGEPYPLIPSFNAWPFPHDNLPPLYSGLVETAAAPPAKTYAASDLSTAVNCRDKVCRLTGFQEEADVAHLIPAKEEGWFDRNAMSQYSCDVTSNSSVNDVANCLLLRADVHRLFDQHKFVFIPKHASFEVEEKPSLHLVCHLIGSSLELTEYYHNVPLRPTPGLSTEYLLAAFARVIFPLLGPFLRCQRPRRLIIVIGDSITIEEVPGDKCAMMALATGSRSRSVSPRKRAAPGGSSATQDNALALQVSDQSAEEVRGIKGTKVQGTEDIHQMDGFQGYNARTANPSLSTKRVRCSSAAFEGDTNKDQKPDPPSRTDAPSPRPAVKPTESTRPVPKNPAMPAEIYRLASLRTQALHLERKRSGVETWWNLQREWAHNNREGLSPKRIRRLFWYQGRDLESNGEGVPWELEVTSTDSSAYNG